jgi:Encapsulating protein for peroxidase
MNGDEWLEAHRPAVEQVIASETEQALLAQRLLPEYPVPETTRFVSIDRFDYETGTVDDQTRVDLELFKEKVEIPKLQVDDPDPARALVAVRRAAQLLSRQHDTRVFQKELAENIGNQPNRGQPKKGQRGPGQPGQPQFHPVVEIEPVNGSIGEGMIAAVTEGIGLLDDQGYRTGYAIVASNLIWTELHRRGEGATTLPIESVRALIDDGPVHRSSVLDNGAALLMSLAEERLDRVTAACLRRPGGRQPQLRALRTHGAALPRDSQWRATEGGREAAPPGREPVSVRR